MTDILETLKKLPEMCATHLPTTKQPVMLKRGHTGYWPLSEGFDVAGFNTRHNVTEKQKLAMEIGSMRGFDVPGADPDNL